MLDRADQITIRAWYGWIPTARLAKQIRKPVEAVEAEAIRLGLRRPTKAALVVMEAQEANVIKAYRKRNLAEMAEAARLRAQIQCMDKQQAKAAEQAERIMQREAERAEKLRRREEEMLERNRQIIAEYPETTNRDLARKYRVGTERIAQIARDAGVTKSQAYISRINRKSSENIKNLYGSKVHAMRRAIEHLRSGDHMTALGILEEALA